MKETDTKNPISADASRERSSDNAMAYDGGLGAVRAPADWSRPMLDFVFLPAHAQASAPGRGSFALSSNNRISSVEVVVPGGREADEDLVLLLSPHMNPTRDDIDNAAEALGVMFVAQAGQTLESPGVGADTALVINNPVAGGMQQISVAFTDPLPAGLAGTSSRLWASFVYRNRDTREIRPADGAQPLPVDVSYPELVTRGRVSIDGRAITSAEVPQTVRYSVPQNLGTGRIRYSLPPNSPLVFVDENGNNPSNEVIRDYMDPGPGVDPVVQTLRVRLKSGLSAAGMGETELSIRHTNAQTTTNTVISTDEDVISYDIPAPASGTDDLTISTAAGVGSPASGTLTLRSMREPGDITLRIVNASDVLGFDGGNLDDRTDLRQTVPVDRQQFIDSRPAGGFPAGEISFSIEFLLTASSDPDLLNRVQSEYIVEAFYTPEGEQTDFNTPIATEPVRIAGSAGSFSEMERIYLEQLRIDGTLPSDAIIIRWPDMAPDGAVGPPGATGATGSGGGAQKGNPGPPGPPGATGAASPQGATGLPGASGDPGLQGATGIDVGVAGVPGASGPIGETALSPTAPAGPPGDPGPRGATGPDGPFGPPGPDLSVVDAKELSFIGPSGPTGATGLAGPTGPTGATGGEIGATGALGPPGDLGPAGTSGETGMSGATGATGLAGPAGETGAPGSLTEGPQGPPGDDGARGDLGLPGPSGLQGPAGVAGPAGPGGDPGATGAPGMRGMPGMRGVAGPAGATGATGTDSRTGATGATGLIGATGLTGPQ